MSATADTLVETDLERRFLEELRGATGEVDGPMERHCVRCFLFAELLAARRGVRIDRELALCAALVHDIGLYPSVSHGGVYTDEGGELAERIFIEAGESARRAELIRDACAQHHALRDQSDRGAEVELMRLADRIELSSGLLRAGLDRGQVRDVFARVSRRGTYGVIAGLVGHALHRAPADRAADLQGGLTPVARFDQPQDPLFARINASIGFDRRLWREDVQGSRVHAAGLERAGVLDAAELAELERGLDAVGGRARGGRVRLPRRRRGHPHGGRAPAHRDRSARWAASCTPAARATTRSRPTWRCSSRNRAERALELIAALMERLLELAEAHADWRMPGYTHLQRAQPVYLGHHLLAYFWMLERDAIRFDFARRSTMAMPLGSGALAGLNWDLDRGANAEALGFARPSPELHRRRLEPRLRARLPLRGDRLRDAPVPPRRRDRHLVQQRVRLLRARRRVRVGLEPDAAEEEPRRRRAPARARRRASPAR